MINRNTKKRSKGRKIRKGLVIVYTGNGKGKTTAALGISMRAWGRGLRVAIIQFIKSEKSNPGEIKAAEKMGIEVIKTGDGWTWLSKDKDATIARGVKAWEIAMEMILTMKEGVLILDEFTYPLHFGWLATNEVIEWIQDNKPEMLHLIITGRSAPEELINFADLVTEMKEIKHPYQDQGIRSQIGVDY